MKMQVVEEVSTHIQDKYGIIYLLTIMVEQISNRSILTGLKEYWFLFIFIGMLIIGWTRIDNSVQAQSNRLDKAEQNISNQAAVVQSIAVDISSIKTTLDFIKQRVQ